MAKTELLSSPERRRRFTLEEKKKVLMEVSQPGASLAAIARKYDLSQSVIYSWRKNIGGSAFDCVAIASHEMDEIKEIQPKSLASDVCKEVISVILKSGVTINFPMTASPSSIVFLVKSMGG